MKICNFSSTPFFVLRFLIFCFLGFGIPLFSETITGKVVSVHDGDTIRVLQNKEQIKIRLFGIDAPETSQSFGKNSRDTLRSLIHKKEVKVEVKELDKYGRTVGVVYLDGKNINLEMVKLGMAWVYRTYNKSSEYIQSENTAREEKRGLWQDSDPTPPWSFRKNEKQSKPIRFFRG